LMADAMNVMHKGMHSAPYTVEPDRDFVTMMIPPLGNHTLRVYVAVPQLYSQACVPVPPPS
jgi:uncharacterized protein (DUF305 family)